MVRIWEWRRVVRVSLEVGGRGWRAGQLGGAWETVSVEDAFRLARTAWARRFDEFLGIL